MKLTMDDNKIKVIKEHAFVYFLFDLIDLRKILLKYYTEEEIRKVAIEFAKEFILLPFLFNEIDLNIYLKKLNKKCVNDLSYKEIYNLAKIVRNTPLVRHIFPCGKKLLYFDKYLKIGCFGNLYFGFIFFHDRINNDLCDLCPGFLKYYNCPLKKAYEEKDLEKSKEYLKKFEDHKSSLKF